MFVIYEVCRNADQTEGRGPMVPIKRISDRDAAVAYIEAQPDAYGIQRKWINDRYGDFQLRQLDVFESLEEIEDYVPIDKRQRALDKLNDEDKRALGL